MKSTRNIVNDMPMMLFERQKDWAGWLGKNHVASSGVWLKLAKWEAAYDSPGSRYQQIIV